MLPASLLLVTAHTARPTLGGLGASFPSTLLGAGAASEAAGPSTPALAVRSPRTAPSTRLACGDAGRLHDRGIWWPPRLSRAVLEAVRKSVPMAPRYEVLRWIPNLMCYTRVAMVLACLALVQRPVAFVSLYCAGAILDLLDGMVARRLQQCSRLGVVLDVWSDNVSRAAAWLALVAVEPAYAPLSLFIVVLEMSTLVATQCAAAVGDGQHWKKRQEEAPAVVAYYFRNNFVNPLGTSGILGLFLLPVALYVRAVAPQLWSAIPGGLSAAVLAWLAAGRLVSAGIEAWFVWLYVEVLLDDEPEAVLRGGKAE